MKFLKVKSKTGNIVLVNIDNITSVWQTGKDGEYSMICTSVEDESVTTPVSVEYIEKVLNSLDHGCIIEL
jgi:hypothetical protein